MAILNIQLGQVGLVGIEPRLVYIDTNDSVSTVQTTGYLNQAVESGFQFQPTDMACVVTHPNAAGWYKVGKSGSNWSLEIIGGSSSGATDVQVQQSAFNYGIDTGLADAYIVDLTPTVTSLTDGLMVAFQPLNNNLTTSPTLQINGLAPTPIYIPSAFSTLNTQVDDLSSSQVALLIYCSASNIFTLLNPVSSFTAANGVVRSYYTSGNDTGTADAYNVNLPLSLDSLYNGSLVMFTPAHVNLTTSPTISVDGFTANIIKTSGAVSAGDLTPSLCALLMYSTAASAYILLNPATSTSSGRNSSAPTVALGTAYHNTLGYDVMITVYLEVATATAADILLGIGSTVTPTQQTVVSALTLAATNVIPVSFILPNQYYALLSTSGTISVSISGQIEMGL